MKEKPFAQLLQQKIDALPRELEPERDLWPGIDLALEERARNVNRQYRRTAIAASIAVFGLVGLLFLNSLTGQQGRRVDMDRLISSMSGQHEDYKQLLLTRYQQQPALTDNWQEQLQELDDAAAVIKSALKEDPGDGELIKLLQQVYQQQINLIQSVHQPGWL